MPWYYTPESVTIGTTTWMAKNLDIDDGGEGIWIVDNVSANGVDMGTQYFYQWDAAVRVANNIKGWHLPTDGDWIILRNSVGGTSVAPAKLKSTTGWSNNGNGTDDYGFTVLPVGCVIGGTNIYKGQRSIFWTSTDQTSVYAYHFYIWDNNNNGINNTNKSSYYSVRLVKD